MVNYTKRADELFKNVGWAYWSYTKAIINTIYAENGWEKIAFTNMVKCNNSDTIDATTEFTRDCCLTILKEEIKLLEPNVIVFYTKDYDTQIEKLFDNITNSKEEYVSVGKKQMNSWTFDGIISNNLSRVMRIGHPERMKKADYINHVINFIKQ